MGNVYLFRSSSGCSRRSSVDPPPVGRHTATHFLAEGETSFAPLPPHLARGPDTTATQSARVTAETPPSLCFTWTFTRPGFQVRLYPASCQQTQRNLEPSSPFMLINQAKQGVSARQARWICICVCVRARTSFSVGRGNG